MGEGEAGFAATAAQNWADFKVFMWNGDSKEFMGRNGKSWAEILLFFAVFYILLAAWWLGFLYLVLSNQPVPYEAGPRLTGYLVHRGPGIHVVPSWKVLEPGVRVYDLYDDKAKANYITETTKFMDDSGLDFSGLGDCSKDSFAAQWESNTPCFYFYLNKISGFVPEPKKLDGVAAPIRVVCDGVKGYDKQKIEDGQAELFFPKTGFNLEPYPWTFEKEWQAPVVAAKINLKSDAEGQVRVNCKVLGASNIFLDSEKPNIGMSEFKIRITK